MRALWKAFCDAAPRLTLLAITGLFTSLCHANPVTYFWVPDESDGSSGRMILSYGDTDPAQSDDNFSDGDTDFIDWKSPTDWPAPYHGHMGILFYPGFMEWSAVDGVLVDGWATSSDAGVGAGLIFTSGVTSCSHDDPYPPSQSWDDCYGDGIFNSLLITRGRWVLENVSVPAPAGLFAPGLLGLVWLIRRKQA